MMEAMDVDLDHSFGGGESDSSSGHSSTDGAPEISLEWSDMTVTFTVLSDYGQDPADPASGSDSQKGFAIYPQLDPAAPSSKTLLAQRRRLIRSQRDKNPMTLSSLIGGGPSMASQPAGFFNTVASAMPHLQETATKAQPSGGTVKRSSLDAPAAAAAPDVKAFKPEVPVTVPKKPLSAETTPVKSSPVTSPLAAGPGSAEAQSNKKDSNKYRCHLCTNTYKKKTYLKRHIKTHTHEKPYKCDICNWAFNQHCNLKRHMISHNLDNGAEGFKCQHCKASFTTKSVLSVHMRDAHGDKLVTKKEQRNNATAAAGNTNATVVSSAPSGPIQTSPSPQTPQKQVSPFRQHHAVISPGTGSPTGSPVKIPLTQSPGSVTGNSGNWSQCGICGKCFVTEANLKQHMLLHEGKKPFKCNFCGLRFSQRPNLKKHLLESHAGGGQALVGQTYPCPTCSILFRTREDLAQHILKQHPLDMAVESSGAPTTSGSSSNIDEEEEEEEEIPAPMETEPAEEPPKPQPATPTPPPPLPAPKKETTTPKASPMPKLVTPPSSSTKSEASKPISTNIRSLASNVKPIPPKGESAKVAAEKAPTNQKSTTPSQKSALPTQKTATPAQKTATSTLKSTTSAQKSVASAPKSATPTQKSAPPAQKSNTPNQRSATPTQRSATPTQRSATPTQRSATPTQRSGTPTQTRSATPTQVARSTTPNSVTSEAPSLTNSETPSTSETPTETKRNDGEAKRTQKGPNPNKPATTYTCAICGASFAKVAQRNKHINDNHSLLTPPAPTTVIEPPKTKK